MIVLSYELTWLRYNKASWKNGPVFAETAPYHSMPFAMTSRKWCNIMSTFNLAYCPVVLEGKRKPELFMVFHDSPFVLVVGTTHDSFQSHLPPTEPLEARQNCRKRRVLFLLRDVIKCHR